MTEAWVANASPLILLGRIGQLDLMEHLASQIFLKLIDAGMFLDPDLLERVLSLAGE